MDSRVLEQLLRLGIIGALDFLFVKKQLLSALVLDDLKTVAIKGVLRLASGNIGDIHIDAYSRPRR